MHACACVYCAGPSLWDQYLQLLPSEKEVCCLLNYGEEEAQELQLKELIVSCCHSIIN